MTRKRNIGRAATIGGLTAAIALLTGLPAANADELGDLRANQELLQRRIDQLAQAQLTAPGGVPGGGAAGSSVLGVGPTPGAAIIGGSFPRSFLIPGTDTSIRVGGFVDLTALYFLNGAASGNPGRPTSNSGQNGNLDSLPINGPISVPGLPLQANSAAHSRGNGVFTQSPQQSRFNVETRTPTAWGEARTFFEWDFSGCNNFSCQTLQQGGGDSLLPRLRFAYGTLGGFLGGQAISNFSDADADTESMEFGGAMGSTGGYRVPQVRYTLAGPWGSAFSVSAEQPTSSVLTPGGIVSNDTNTTGTVLVGTLPNIGTICNGVACTGAGTPVNGNLGRSIAPVITGASYWAQPWGHVDFAVMANPLNYNDGAFVSRTFLGYGGHIAGDVKPGWFGWSKDDFLFSFIAGDGIGNYASGGEATFIPMATNYSVLTQCATPRGTCIGGLAASNIIFKPVFGYSANGGYQHWWTPNLRSTIAAGSSFQDISSQLIGPNQAIGANKQLWNAFVNLVWSPVAFVTTGVQYMYGQRTVVSNARGNENVLIGKFRVAF
jgi:hypothetical protein